MRNGDCRIVHREFIQDVVAGTGTPSVFSDVQIAVNPGQSTSFPWLSSIAGRFESYQFRKLKYCYETEAPSSLGGTLVLSLDYDATDPAPSSKQQALAYRNAVRSAPWTTCCHSSDLEDLSKQKSYFVRPAGQPVGTDIKMYDVGNLSVISQGVTTASATLGELYVEYDVLLMTPVLESFAQVGSISASTGSAASIVLAPITTSGNISLIPLLDVVSISGLQVGAEYLIQVCNGTSSTFTSSAPVGLTLVTQIQTNGSANSFAATFKATATSGSLTMTASAATSDVVFSVILLSPMPLF